MDRVVRFLGAACVAVLVGVVAASVWSNPALADTTQTFTTPGHTTFTVPAGVTAVTFTVWGARGGDGGGSGAGPCTAGGSGAFGEKIVVGVSVTPGQIYDLYVGARGGDGACGDDGGAGGAAGVGGNADTNGGAGGAGSTTGVPGTDLGGGGGGGGGSDIRLGSTEIVAAGGGGGGGAGALIGGTGGSGGGDSTTGKGANSTGSAQGGGSGNTGGGSGGSSGPGPAGANGTAHAGGAGGTATDTTNGAGGGGGGGGGYYGGGGGGQAGSNTDGGGGGGGGYGGSINPPNPAPTPGSDPGNSGNGEITITYVAPPITGTASSITNTTATINGTDSNGDTYHFDYGTTLAYGSSTTPATATSSTLSADLTGLSPGTTYHFRIVSSEGGNGADATFTTPALPPPVTGSATAISATGATLQGTDPNPSPDTYHFEWGADTTYGASTPVTPSASGTLSYALTGLTPGTTYHFRIVSSGGGDGMDATFTTMSVPVTGTATAVTATGATLQGTDVNTGESYHFEYGTDTSYGTSTPTGTAASGTLTAVLTGLTPGTTYHFRIVGDSGAGSDATFTTGVPPVTGSAVSIGATGATLEGTDANAGESYHFEYGKTTSYGQSTAAKTAASGTLKAAIAGLTPDTTYHFRIVGDAGAGSDATFTTTVYDAKLVLKGPKKGKVGTKLRYRLTFTNTGTGTIARPFGQIRFSGAKIKVLTKPGCTKSVGYVCKYAALTAGRSASVTLVIRAVKPGKVRALVSIITVGNLRDPTPADDAGKLVTTISR